MPQIKLRMGEVDAEEMLPNLQALEQKAKNARIQGGRGNRRYAEEIERTEDYLYLFFVKEVSEERKQFIEGADEDDVSLDFDDTFFARSMRFLLREDKKYAFQSTRGVYGEDAIDYILHDTDVMGLDCSRKETFPSEWMESFYNSTHSIRKVKLKDTGENASDDVNENIADLIEEVGGPTERTIFSTAGRDSNLRGSTLIDSLVKMSDLKFVSGMDAEGELTKLNQTGRLTFSYPANLDHAMQAERMYAATERILNHIN